MVHICIPSLSTYIQLVFFSVAMTINKSLVHLKTVVETSDTYCSVTEPEKGQRVTE